MQYPFNIKIRFAGEVVTLSDKDDRQTTPSGVTLHGRMRGPEFQPLAEIPDGTLEKYKHERPKILSADWS